jgi:hypothetical protein
MQYNLDQLSDGENEDPYGAEDDYDQEDEN